MANLCRLLFIVLSFNFVFAKEIIKESNVPYVEKYFDQTLDHFNFVSYGDKTFKQRYLMTDTWWDHGKGPIFFYTGNEGPITAFWDATGFMFDITPQFGALVVFAEHLFDKLRAQNPDFKSKCVAVGGDILKVGLGISQSDEDTLVREVSVVIHSAATIKFDEEMKYRKLSMEMNVFGVKSMIALSKKMHNLVVFVHISTAYSNCDQKTIKEEFYQPPMQPKQLLSAVEWMDAETLNTLTPKMVGSRPNTYTFTKAIAEYLLYEESQGLPIAIFRPSIVGATYLEPVRVVDISCSDVIPTKSTAHDTPLAMILNCGQSNL